MTTAMQFTKATKRQAKLRCALFGPSGSGKTFSALRIATGLGGPVALIDTERGSASKYADRFQFDVLELTKRDIPTYEVAIRAAGEAGYAVLVVDSLSHAWQELLEEVDKLARAKYRGNSWSAWSEGTPKQKRLVEALLGFPGHVIATMRSKTEWTTESADGKSKPIRVGLAPEQRSGMEYEFDLVLELSTDHLATVLKDRTGRFQDRMIEKPGEEFGQELSQWLQDGEPALADTPPRASSAAAAHGQPAPASTSTHPDRRYPNGWTAEQIAEIRRRRRECMVDEKAFITWFQSTLGVARLTEARSEVYPRVLAWIDEHSGGAHAEEEEGEVVSAGAAAGSGGMA